jgi:hypothetical protein
MIDGPGFFIVAIVFFVAIVVKGSGMVGFARLF